MNRAAVQIKYQDLLEQSHFEGLRTLLHTSTNHADLVKTLAWARDHVTDQAHVLKLYTEVLSDLTAITVSDYCDHCHRGFPLNEMVHITFNGINFWGCLDCVVPVTRQLNQPFYTGKTLLIAGIWFEWHPETNQEERDPVPSNAPEQITVYEDNAGNIYLHRMGSFLVYQDNPFATGSTLTEDAEAIISDDTGDWNEDWVHPLDAIRSLLDHQETDSIAIWTPSNTIVYHERLGASGKRFLGQKEN